MHFHPGALFRNRWSCCQQQGRTSLGCQPTYHLLTRSSSRYAQMRRKDTLSSSYSSGRRRSKSGSVPREDQVSGPPDSLQVPADDPSSSGRGLSNSCFDLTHKQIHNQFEAPETESQRCSQQSTETSISMGCVPHPPITSRDCHASRHSCHLWIPLPTQTPRGHLYCRGRTGGVEFKWLLRMQLTSLQRVSLPPKPASPAHLTLSTPNASLTLCRLNSPQSLSPTPQPTSRNTNTSQFPGTADVSDFWGQSTPLCGRTS